MHGHLPLQEDIARDKNISRTIHEFRAGAKPVLVAVERGEEGDQGCAYIAAETWPPGAPPYCGAPVRPGSAYCASHARLCSAAPTSVEGAQIAMLQDLAARAVPPPELEHLAPTVLPEPIEAEEALDARELPPMARQESVAAEEQA